MLSNVFDEEIESMNAQKLLNRIYRPNKLKNMISHQRGQSREMKIRQTRKAIATLKTLLCMVDNNSTTTSKAAGIMAAMCESISTLVEYKAEL